MRFLPSILEGRTPYLARQILLPPPLRGVLHPRRHLLLQEVKTARNLRLNKNSPSKNSFLHPKLQSTSRLQLRPSLSLRSSSRSRVPPLRKSQAFNPLTPRRK
mmetsp:Transcript_21163/g.32800  ORF Transcript_21163/g.32800 Transcript_21163/m.32800 type:complete len:103 (-) Transcript_21163:2088-2396(-)